MHKCLLIVYYMNFELLYYLTSDVISTGVMPKIAPKTSYLHSIFIHIGPPEAQFLCSAFSIESSAAMVCYYLMCASCVNCSFCVLRSAIVSKLKYDLHRAEAEKLTKTFYVHCFSIQMVPNMLVRVTINFWDWPCIFSRSSKKLGFQTLNDKTVEKTLMI